MAVHKPKRRGAPANALPFDEPRPAAGKPAKGRNRPQTTKKNAWGAALGYAMLLVMVALFAFPTFLIIMCGMAPSLSALMVDDRRSPYKAPTIAAANFAAVIPYIALLWRRGHDLSDATHLLTDPYVWAAMYSGALAGMALLWIGPLIMAAVMSGMAIQRRRTLDTLRKQLLEEWGDGLLSGLEPQKQQSAETQKKNV